MTPELIAILAIGVSLGGGQLATARWVSGRFDRMRDEIGRETSNLRSDITSLRTETSGQIASLRAEITGLRDDTSSQIAGLRAEITGLRKDVAELRDRSGRVEGLLEGLRDAISARRDIA